LAGGHHRSETSQREREFDLKETHPSALAVPSYHRIPLKHGLIEKTLSIPDAYEVFLKVGADSEVEKLRRNTPVLGGKWHSE
jgi:hypothetical protein